MSFSKLARPLALTLFSLGCAQQTDEPAAIQSNLTLTPFGNCADLEKYIEDTAVRDMRLQLDQLLDNNGDIFGRVDGAPAPVTWSQVVVGLGTPEVRAGTFSVDLIAALCVRGRGAHQLTLHDRYELAQPGETEVMVEAAPGVTVERARLAGAADPDLDWRLAGPARGLADGGLELAFAIGDRALIAPDATCPAGAAPRGLPTAGVIGGGAVIGAGLAAVVARRRRRARG